MRTDVGAQSGQRRVPQDPNIVRVWLEGQSKWIQATTISRVEHQHSVTQTPQNDNEAWNTTYCQISTVANMTGPTD